MLRQEVADAVQNMPSGTHAVLVYDSQENKHDVLFHHLRSGIRKEGLVYICAEETPEDIKQEMEVFGIQAGDLVADGQLSIMNYDEVYIKGGKVDPPKIIAGFADAARQYRNKGMMGIRGAGEMSGFFREGKVGELLQYEKALNTSFSFAGKGICAYNLVEMGTSGNLELLWPLIRAHGMVIMTGPKGGFALDSARTTEKDVEMARVAVMR